MPINRRVLLKSLAGLGVTASAGSSWLLADPKQPVRKRIPVSAELLPIIGMGSSSTFDVTDPQARAALLPVVRAFFDQGGALIDTSPAYGAAEQVLGELLGQVSNDQALFAATKVWSTGKDEGIAQMRRSMRLMGVTRFDLIQIHNLRDWQVQLETLREWKQAGRLRYIGITTSHGRNHRELEAILDKEPFDFVQFTYSIVNRGVEQRLLPIARERKVAVLANRPYERGAVFGQVKDTALPQWASEFDCHSWGQYFLKYVVSHPDVTCVIPATSRVSHMLDNMGAGFGRLPDAAMRQKMEDHFDSLQN